MKTRDILFPFLFCLGSVSVYAQAGSPDPAFGGGDGRVTTSFFTELPAEGVGIAVQQDGKILVCGYTHTPGGISSAVLTRYMPDGSLDNSFNGNGKIMIPAAGGYSSSRAVTLQPDGKIVVSVNYKENGETKLGMYRFLTDGSPDTSFDMDGIATTSLGADYLTINAVNVQPDGKILAGGYVGYAADTFDVFLLVRYLPDGTPDPGFDGDGVVTTLVGESYTNIFSVLVQPDGKIIASGYADFGQGEDFAVARYNSNGSLDPTFSGDGIAMATFSSKDDHGYDAALQPDGKIVVGGSAYSPVKNGSEFAVARFNADGTLDHSFHGDGMTNVMVSEFPDGLRGIALQPDGKIVLGGYAHSSSQAGTTMAIVRLNDNGIPDSSFDGDGVAIYENEPNVYSTFHDLAIQSDGKIVGTGFLRTESINSMAVVRVLSGLTVSTIEEHFPVMDMALFPNPIHDHVNLTYTLDQKETITICLNDMQGKMVQPLLPSTERYSGTHRDLFRIHPGLAPGSYFVTLAAGNRKASMKVVLE